MQRNYVVSYDISDDKRRAAVFKLLWGFGNRAQYSVFFCELTDTELVRMRALLREILHHEEDQVMILDLGPESRPLESGLEVIGRPYNPPTRMVVV